MKVADLLKAERLRYAALAPFIERIERPRFKWDRFKAIREYYAAADLKTAHQYDVDWLKIFTPIEYGIWQDIRCLGIPMWPQYPVGQYFIDFADPRRHIGIECDGRHHVPEKDRIRDNQLGDLGWLIIRIQGRDCLDEHYGERLLGRLYGVLQ